MRWSTPASPQASSLPNTATVSYSTRSTPDGHVTPGSNDVAEINTDDASITIDGCTISKSGPAGPFTIGDRYTYNLDVTVPARTVAFWPTVTDALNREGFIATGTPTITTLAGAPLTVASFANTATAPVRSTPASGSTLFTFDLSDPIDNSNSGSAYTFRISFDVIFTATRGAGSWEFPPPATAYSANDTGRILWNTVHSAARATNSSAVSNVVSTSFNQPLLTTVKSIVTTVTPGPFVGGQDILYRVRVTNTGSSRAYGVSFVDTMPAASSSATLTLAQLSGVGDVRPNMSLTSTTTVLRGSFDSAVSIGTTQTLTLEYRVTLAPNVGAGVNLTNTADLNWASLPSTPTGSRTYNDGAYENWTADTSSVTTAAAPATITKRASTAGDIRIGDTVTYSIDCTVPANTVMWWPTISDRLDKRGGSYVSQSATITTRANPPSVPATFSVTSTPTVTLTSGNSTTYGWALADPIDNSGNPLPYAFTLSFTVRYNGLNGANWEMWPAGTANPGNSLNDTASVAWRDVSAGGPTPNHAITSNSVATTVRQPLIRTVKSIVTTVTPPPFVGGSPIRYRITMTNPGYNRAYDIVMTDTFPAEVQSAVLASATLSGVGSIMSSVTVVTALPTSTVTFDQSVSMWHHADDHPRLRLRARAHGGRRRDAHQQRRRQLVDPTGCRHRGARLQRLRTGRRELDARHHQCLDLDTTGDVLEGHLGGDDRHNRLGGGLFAEHDGAGQRDGLFARGHRYRSRLPHRRRRQRVAAGHGHDRHPGSERHARHVRRRRHRGWRDADDRLGDAVLSGSRSALQRSCRPVRRVQQQRVAGVAHTGKWRHHGDRRRRTGRLHGRPAQPHAHEERHAYYRGTRRLGHLYERGHEHR